MSYGKRQSTLLLLRLYQRKNGTLVLGLKEEEEKTAQLVAQQGPLI